VIGQATAAGDGSTFTGIDWALLAVVLGLFLLSIVLSVAETALTRVSHAKAQALADQYGARGRTLLSLVEGQEWLNPVLFVVLASQLIQSTLLGVLAGRVLPGLVGVAAITILNVTVFFVFAEAAPKTWAIQHADRAALFFARPIRALADFWPLRIISRGLIGLTNVILPGKGLKRGPYVSEEELLAVADLAMADEVIDAGERDLISSIIEFGDTIVREVMVPRPDMISVSADFRVADVMEVVILNGYSRVPVTDAGIDDVVGVAYAKDLMRAERDGLGDEPVRSLMRAARFVPETKKVSPLLRELQLERVHLAVVVDEHGGTAGLVTLEDLLEELVGEITDEYDADLPELTWAPDGHALVVGSTPVDEVNQRLGLGLPENDEYDSVGGFVLHELAHVPTAGESVTYADHVLVVDRMHHNRIDRLRIEMRDASTDADADGGGAAESPAGPRDHETERAAARSER
jgi:CBS domain containing-hemolysin-like protein